MSSELPDHPANSNHARVMIVHSEYTQVNPSGEHRVRVQEEQALRARGISVLPYVIETDQILSQHPMRIAARMALTPWNPKSASSLITRIRSVKPDVVHFHNVFPWLSPSVIAAAKSTGVRTVLTVHNHRWFCINGFAFRNNSACTRCLYSSPWRSIPLKCYRGSYAASSIAALSTHNLRQVFSNVDALITLSTAQQRLLLEAGIPQRQLHFKPNFLPTPPTKSPPWENRDLDAIFIGRLGPEKGLQFLFRVWEQMNPPMPSLDIIGSGPELASAKAYVHSNSHLSKSIRFHGKLTHSETLKLLRRARVLLFPSLWPEPFGLTVLEALSSGTGVLGTREGAAADLVREHVNGQLLPAHEASWANSISALFMPGNGTLKHWSLLAPESVPKIYLPDNNISTLLRIYAGQSAHTDDS